MDSGIECILSNFACDNQLCRAVNTLEGRASTHRDLERLASVNLIKFKKANCKMLQLCQGNPKHKYKQYRLGREFSKRGKTWGCWLLRGSTLPSNMHSLTVQKASYSLDCIKSRGDSKLREVIVPFCSAFVKPHLDY